MFTPVHMVPGEIYSYSAHKYVTYSYVQRKNGIGYEHLEQSWKSGDVVKPRCAEKGET